MKYIIVDQNIHYYIIYYITILILVYSVNTFNDLMIKIINLLNVLLLIIVRELNPPWSVVAVDQTQPALRL